MRLTVTILVMSFERMDHQTHGLTLGIAYAVLRGRPLFFLNKPGKKRTGSHMMIGPNDRGNLWTVILLRTYDPGYFECLTGWPSVPSECTLYHGAMAH